MSDIREALEKAYDELAINDFLDGERIKFIAALGASGEIDYHYKLICDSWKSERRLYLENSFDRHGPDGLEFLFKKISEAEDEVIKVLTEYLIAEILSKSRHRDFYKGFCERLIPILISDIKTCDEILRRKLIIALGWVGTSNEISFLTRQMLSDDDALCRVWSASSLMHVSFHGVSKEEVCEASKDAFAKILSEEKDIQACGLILESVQTLFGKKWVSSSAVENVDEAKIEKGRKSALRFLSKL
jgi:hypothetical protein